MATQSTPPLDDENPAKEVVQPTTGGLPDTKSGFTTENSTKSVFVNSEPIREEQVQNAMKFLSHPKVRGSPVMYRRSFLERKGLTKEEIDEAFRRVPDPSPAVVSGQTAEDGQLKPSSNIQTQPPTQNLQPQVAPPAGVISKAGALTQYRFHWSHALVVVGALAVSGAGTAVLLKNSIVPRLKSWIRKVVSEERENSEDTTNLKPSLGEETAAAAKAAAAAAADAARASQDMLVSKTDEKRCFEELMKLLDMQVQEMKSMSNAIKKLEGESSTMRRSQFVEQEDQRISAISSRPWEGGQTQNNTSYVLPPQERSNGLNTNTHDYSRTNQYNGDTSSQPWQRKNVRITEYENEDEPRPFSSGVVTNQRPVQRSWVPPQPPPIAIAEAAAAIRQPKKPSFQREQVSDDQLLAHSTELTDELQRVTKISESGGMEEANGVSLKQNGNEIQEDDAIEQN